MDDRMLETVKDWNFVGYDKTLGRIKRIDATYHPSIWDEAARLERGWKRQAVRIQHLEFDQDHLRKVLLEKARLGSYVHRSLAVDLATALVAKSIWEAWNED